MSAAENHPSPDQLPKGKGKPARRRSRPSKSSTAEQTPPQAELAVVPSEEEAWDGPSLELMLNPMVMLLDSGAGVSEADLSTDNPVLAVLKDALDGMRSGKNIDDLRVPMLQLMGNQEERAKIFRGLILANDYNRVVKFLILEDKVEQIVFQHALQGKLKPEAALSFWRTLREEITTIKSSIAEGAAAGGDVTTLLNKVNLAVNAQEEMLSKKLKGSPQNRELVRKAIYKLAKLTRDKRVSTTK